MTQKRICECCGVEYYPSSSAQKNCVSCRLVGFHLAVGSRGKKKDKRPKITITNKNQ